MRVIVKGSLGFKQLRSAALDSGGHEGLWAQAGSRGRFGYRPTQRVALGSANARGRFRFGRTRETLWVHTSLKGCFGYGQVKKSVLGMGKR